MQLTYSSLDVGPIPICLHVIVADLNCHVEASVSQPNTAKHQHSVTSTTFSDIKSTSRLIQTQAPGLLYPVVNWQSQLPCRTQ